MTSQQDMGGKTGDSLASVGLDEVVEPLKMFEAKVEALYKICANRPRSERFSVQTATLRARIEQLPPQVFDSWSYYARWGASLAAAGLDQQWWTDQQLRDAVGLSPHEARRRVEAFPVGALVRVRDESAAVPYRRPHLRTPGYVHGMRGKVVAHLRDEKDQDFVAHSHIFGNQGEAPVLRVYRVRFIASDIWPRVDVTVPDDEVDVEIFEDWLEECDNDDHNLDHGNHNHDHDHDHHHHDHDDVVDHGDHVHESRAHVEQTAVEREGQPLPGERFCLALVELAIAQGVTTREALVRVNFSAGQQLVAKAWMDADFKQRLLDEKQANAAVQEFLGITMSCQLVVCESTPLVHPIVVCTLCSCFPTQLLGRPPLWYKERSYRARTVLEPRKVLAEFGCQLAAGQKVRVVDSTSECRYMVLPARPTGTDDWTAERLAAIVTRDSLIGVRNIAPPQQ